MTYIGRYTTRPRIMNPSGPLPEVRFTQSECLRNWLPPHTHDPPHTRLTGEVCPVRVSEVRSSSPCFLLRSADTRRGCRLIAGNCQLRVLQMGLSKNRTPGLRSEDAPLTFPWHATSVCDMCSSNHDTAPGFQTLETLWEKWEHMRKKTLHDYLCTEFSFFCLIS